MDDGTKLHARKDQVILSGNCVALQPFIAKLGKIYNVASIIINPWRVCG